MYDIFLGPLRLLRAIIRKKTRFDKTTTNEDRGKQELLIRGYLRVKIVKNDDNNLKRLQNTQTTAANFVVKTVHISESDGERY